MENYLNISDLCVGYQNKALLCGIQLSIKKGEIVCLVGPNGAGKSTILKSITRHLKALSGVVTLEGEDIFSMPGRKVAKKMAVMLTERISSELMTCKDVVSIGRYPHTNTFGKLSKEDEIQIALALKKVAGENLADIDFQKTSDGQKQRILLARAICQQPDIMVLDEPTSFLDIHYKVELLNILRELAKEGMTIILSLHEIELANKIADKIILVNGDQVIAGNSELICSNEKITTVFRIEKESYNAHYGSVELKKPEGVAKTLIIGGGGTGIPVYREFQKRGIPFYAGCLFENDIEYPVAKALAHEVVAAKAFKNIDTSCKERMREILNEVSEVLDCNCAHGELDTINTQIIEMAKEAGKWKQVAEN